MPTLPSPHESNLINSYLKKVSWRDATGEPRDFTSKNLWPEGGTFWSIAVVFPVYIDALGTTVVFAARVIVFCAYINQDF